MQVTLTTHYSDGTVQWQTTVETPDELSALAWAEQNWHPARTRCGCLNDRIMVSVNDGQGIPVRDVIAAAQLRRAA